MFLTKITQLFDSLRPRRNRLYFADDIFKCIFLNENVLILVKISLKFIPKCPINNISELVQIMAWQWPGNTPLTQPMMVRLPTDIYVTWPQWVNGKNTIVQVNGLGSYLHSQGTFHHISHQSFSVQYWVLFALNMHEESSVWSLVNIV